MSEESYELDIEEQLDGAAALVRLQEVLDDRRWRILVAWAHDWTLNEIGNRIGTGGAQVGNLRNQAFRRARYLLLKEFPELVPNCQRTFHRAEQQREQRALLRRLRCEEQVLRQHKANMERLEKSRTIWWQERMERA